MSAQTKPSRKRIPDPSQRRQVTDHTAATTTPEQGTAAPGLLLFCPHCGMPSTFEAETECRYCHHRFCPTCADS